MKNQFETIRITNPGFPEYGLGFYYVGRCIQNADPNSLFARRIKELPEAGVLERIRLLLLQNYDGFLCVRGETIIGHVFFQKHAEADGEEWHMFSVNAHMGGNGNGRAFLTEFLRLAREEGAVRAVIGGGANEWVSAYWDDLDAKRLSLPFPVKTGIMKWEVEFPNE